MDSVSRPDLASTAALLASESRASMLWALLDGRAWTLTELAKAAKISRPTATEHLHRLVDAGLLTEVRQGRHRYVRMHDPAVADLVESLAAYSGHIDPAAPSLQAQRADQALREARTCYRHLAGRLGVALTEGMHRQGYLDANWTLTAEGHDWFTQLGVELPTKSLRAFTRPCLDWTERRDHLAGTAAEALLATFERKCWVEPSGSGRAVRLTSEGDTALGELLDAATKDGSPGIGLQNM
ncbi:winged helix-turn-helix domain-containing protein [Paenarthrobacter sp. NPDC089322]|uniref:ArsR/SmtB family transcription factor n=1 Tax=Paenarthrobacter sp. NPDC089322 TaxID=3155065 RepID=UPI0034458B70